MSDAPARRLAEILRRRRDEPLLVVTGAGISHASGIPTFRGSDPGAIWANDVLEKATRSFFEADPVASWRWSLDRFDAALDAEPNAGHRALEELRREHRGPFTLVTQNVDGLHRAAGSHDTIEVHGTLRRVRCSRDGCENAAPSGSLPRPDEALDRFRDAPSTETLPRCPACRSPLRPHVLWFDELYAEHDDYRWTEVLEAAETLGLALFVGTSFAVGVTDLVVRAAQLRRAPIVAIDPGAAPGTVAGVEILRGAAEVVLPEAVRMATTGGADRAR